MNPRDDDPEFAERRPTFDDLRADYDDDFGRCRTPLEKARRTVLGPAIAFVVIGCLGVLGTLIGAGVLVYQDLNRALNRTGALVGLVVGLFFILLGTCLSAVAIAGGVSLLKLRRRWLALFAAYVVTGLALAGCYAILFFPFGIWGLIVLYRPDVRDQFWRLAPPRGNGHGAL